MIEFFQKRIQELTALRQSIISSDAEALSDARIAHYGSSVGQILDGLDDGIWSGSFLIDPALPAQHTMAKEGARLLGAEIAQAPVVEQVQHAIGAIGGGVQIDEPALGNAIGAISNTIAAGRGMADPDKINDGILSGIKAVAQLTGERAIAAAASGAKAVNEIGQGLTQLEAGPPKSPDREMILNNIDSAIGRYQKNMTDLSDRSPEGHVSGPGFQGKSAAESAADAAQHDQEAAQHAQSAGQHEQEAQTHAQAAGQHEQEAQTHATAAGQHEQEAQTHAQAAGQHEQEAQTHATAAGQHEQEAQTQAQAAGQHEQEAQTHATAAGQHEQEAAQHASIAGQHELEAQHSAAQANDALQQIDQLLAQATDLVQQIEQALAQAQQAAADAEQSASAAANSAAQAAQLADG